MIFNATFNNITAIWWRSVLLIEETGVPRENADLLQVTEKAMQKNGSFHNLHVIPYLIKIHLTDVIYLAIKTAASH